MILRNSTMRGRRPLREESPALRARILEARRLLEERTPLAFDCGRICGAACCHSEGEMILLPGEAELYPGDPRVAEVGGRAVFRCAGYCNRRERPLACRIFPLTVRRTRAGVLDWAMDPRGRGLCPLTRQGKRALAPGFLAAAETVLGLLAAQPLVRAYLDELALLYAQYRELIAAFRSPL